MSTPDLLPELHVTGSFGCKHSDSRRSFGDGEGWAGITHAGRRQGPRRNEGAGATLLPGLQAGGPAPGRRCRPRERFGISPMLLRCLLPCRTPALPLTPAVWPRFSLRARCLFSSSKLCLLTRFLISHLSSLKWPSWPICAFTLHLSELRFC